MNSPSLDTALSAIIQYCCVSDVIGHLMLSFSCKQPWKQEVGGLFWREWQGHLLDQHLCGTFRCYMSWVRNHVTLSQGWVSNLWNSILNWKFHSVEKLLLSALRLYLNDKDILISISVVHFSATFLEVHLSWGWVSNLWNSILNWKFHWKSYF
jgi:hypothetical protein